VRDHAHALLFDAQELNRLAGRELRDRDHPRRGPYQAREQQPAVAARPTVESVWVSEDGEVVDGDDERRG
jgi:hypothetical protein